MFSDAYLPALLKFLKTLRPPLIELYHHQNTSDVHTKSDNSPVTTADLVSHKAILKFLTELTPNIPVISEESETPVSVTTNQFWLIDPLDGTREFIAKTDDFSINVALIENNVAVLGIIYVPVFDAFYFAEKNNGAFKQQGDELPEKIHTRKINTDKPVVIASRRHANNEKLQNFFENIKDYERISRGSAIKFCLIAEGKADLYPRFGETFFWDTAAGQCIVEEAGGAVIDVKGNALRYNGAPPYLNSFFLAVGSGTGFMHLFKE
ncbi:MAG: 3'(2'),5'-bisphosphate nucleotidase CysQ [Gammaproteobacteria bacterium]|nr:3'(2'),5'-bisphosphate nucleotidase CysQ [Gammaproteobacteria bacterium]